MRIKKFVAAWSVIGVALVSVSQVPKATADESKLGTLTCERAGDGGYNLIITSKTPVRCIFSDDQGSEQWYVGAAGVLLGVDVSWKPKETIYFAVASSTRQFTPEGAFLSGEYAGVSADAAVGVGGGASLLVGGSDDTTSLQPAVRSSQGVGVAAGLGYLNIDPDPLNRARIATPFGSPLSQAMYSGYFATAHGYYKQKTYKASDYFGTKAVAAASGRPPNPDEVDRWEVAEPARTELLAQRARLLKFRKNNGGALVDAGHAQVSFDCWLYATSINDQDRITSCKTDFMNRAVAVERAYQLSLAEQDVVAQAMTESWHMALFDTDVSTVSEKAMIALKDVLDHVRLLEEGRVHIMGNTDLVGTKGYNQTLSESRAASTKSALIAAGVPSSWITSEAFGKTNPISISRNPNDALNRRVDVVVSPIRVDADAVKAAAEAEVRKTQQ